MTQRFESVSINPPSRRKPNSSVQAMKSLAKSSKLQNPKQNVPHKMSLRSIPSSVSTAFKSSNAQTNNRGKLPNKLPHNKESIKHDFNYSNPKPTMEQPKTQMNKVQDLKRNTLTTTPTTKKQSKLFRSSPQKGPTN